MKHKVVIIGHGYLSRLALIRSLGQAGYDVIVIVTKQVTAKKNVLSDFIGMNKILGAQR